MDYSKLSDDTMRRIAGGLPLDYSKLSDDEMKELASAVPKAAPALPALSAPPGAIEASLRGAEQGATLGFGDELNGLLEHLATGKSYEQARDESRAKFKAAEDAHPIISTAANFAGALAPAALLGGTSLGASLADMGASLAPKGAEALAGAAARGLGTGALVGGVSGLGNSEAKDDGGLAKDAAEGAITGGALGMLGDVAIEKIKGPLGEYLAKVRAKTVENPTAAFNDLSSVKGTKTAFQAGLDDTRLFGESAKAPLDQRTLDAITPELQKMRDQLSSLSQQKNAMLLNPDNKANVGSWLDNTIQLAQQGMDEYSGNVRGVDDELGTIKSVLERFKNRTDGEGNLSFKDMEKLRDELRSMSKVSDTSLLKTNEATGLATNLITGLERDPNKYEQLMGLQKGMSGLDSYFGDDIKSLNQKMSPLAGFFEDAPEIAQYSDAAKNLNPSINSKQTSDLLDYAIKNLPQDQIESLGPGLKNIVEQYKVAKQMGAHGLGHASPLSGGRFFGETPKAIWYTGANMAGLGIRTMADITPDWMKSTASILKGNALDPVAGALGNVLEQAADRDNSGRNAIMFSIMQNPAYREKMRQFFPDQSQEQK
jgi:hypothetical protein